MATYKEMLLDPRWQKKRLEVLESAGWACEFCFETESTLHVHHARYIKGRKPWEYERSDLKALCADCHSEHHATKAQLDGLLALANRVQLNEITALIGGYLSASHDTTDEQEEFCSDLDPLYFASGVLCRVLASKATFLRDVAKSARAYYPEQCLALNERRTINQLADGHGDLE